LLQRVDVRACDVTWRGAACHGLPSAWPPRLGALDFVTATDVAGSWGATCLRATGRWREAHIREVRSALIQSE
jgi:hypothetical protein